MGKLVCCQSHHNTARTVCMILGISYTEWWVIWKNLISYVQKVHIRIHLLMSLYIYCDIKYVHGVLYYNFFQVTDTSNKSAQIIYSMWMPHHLYWDRFGRELGWHPISALAICKLPISIRTGDMYIRSLVIISWQLDYRRHCRHIVSFLKTSSRMTKYQTKQKMLTKIGSSRMINKNLQDKHYIDVIMTTMVSQITSLTVVYSIVYSGADQRKHQSSASLAFVRGIHRDRWLPRTKGQ